MHDSCLSNYCTPAFSSESALALGCLQSLTSHCFKVLHLRGLWAQSLPCFPGKCLRRYRKSQCPPLQLAWLCTVAPYGPVFFLFLFQQSWSAPCMVTHTNMTDKKNLFNSLPAGPLSCASQSMALPFRIHIQAACRQDIYWPLCPQCLEGCSAWFSVDICFLVRTALLQGCANPW